MLGLILVCVSVVLISCRKRQVSLGRPVTRVLHWSRSLHLVVIP